MLYKSFFVGAVTATLMSANISYANAGSVGTVSGSLNASLADLTASFVASSSIYNLVLQWTSISNPVKGAFGFEIDDTQGNTVTSYFISNKSPGVSASTQVTGLTVGAAYQIDAYESGLATVNNFRGSALPAPGPIAGAGLPAILALGGLIALRRRKPA